MTKNNKEFIQSPHIKIWLTLQPHGLHQQVGVIPEDVNTVHDRKKKTKDKQKKNVSITCQLVRYFYVTILKHVMNF